MQTALVETDQERYQQGILAGLFGIVISLIAGLISPFASAPFAGLTGVQAAIESEVLETLEQFGVSNARVQAGWGGVEVSLVTSLPSGVSEDRLGGALVELDQVASVRFQTAGSEGFGVYDTTKVGGAGTVWCGSSVEYSCDSGDIAVPSEGN